MVSLYSGFLEYQKLWKHVPCSYFFGATVKWPTFQVPPLPIVFSGLIIPLRPLQASEFVSPDLDSHPGKRNKLSQVTTWQLFCIVPLRYS